MKTTVWAFPLLPGTKVVVKFQAPTGAEYYAGSVLKWSQKSRIYYVKAADGKTYPAQSANVKPFDTTDPQGLMDWLAVAQQGPEINSAVLKQAADVVLLQEGLEEDDNDTA